MLGAFILTMYLYKNIYHGNYSPPHPSVPGVYKKIVNVERETQGKERTTGACIKLVLSPQSETY